MRAVVQRVNWAKVEVEEKIVGEIKKGLLVFLGVGQEDTQKDLEWMVNKIPNLRVFEDEDEKMNKSLMDIKGEMLVVSQFTLYGDCRRGRRPSFSSAAPADKAKKMYEDFCDMVEKAHGIKVEKGVFQADMKVSLLNDGPVTLLLESKGTF
ncbi:D-aminoacyl-tRNA deacylase [Mesoaciditoga lauensis]|uniref:D-aminoacyl-tRNA deacylase n=1 Tax=Mesoaciditoga lauensis TaxID=1495039 RepID=UPI00055BC250|nr:D-aminoacyl-tRNA deacylase [Mesoaciditoga lauensis]